MDALQPLVASAVDAICDAPVVLLEQGGRVWSLVSSYTKTLVDEGKWKLVFRARGRAVVSAPDCNVNRAAFTRVVAFDAALAGEPICVAVERSAAKTMWSRLLTLAAASPKELVTDASVARAFRVAQCVDEQCLAPSAVEHETGWANMLYNEHVLGASSDAASLWESSAQSRKAQRMLHSAERRLKRKRTGGEETFSQWWERQLSTSEGLFPDGREPPPAPSQGAFIRNAIFAGTGERAVRALYSGYVYCAYLAAQEVLRGKVVRFGAESSEQVVRLALDTTPEKLMKLALRTRATRAPWPVPAGNVEALFHEAIIACDDETFAGDAAKFMRVMASGEVHAGGWKLAEARARDALPHCPLAGRIARDLWCADKLLRKFHGHNTSRHAHERLVECTGTLGIENALAEARERSMPLQEALLLHLQGTTQDPERSWVTLRLRDSVKSRPTALQVHDMVRLCCEGGEEECVVLGGTRDDAPGQLGRASPVAVCMSLRVWKHLTVGEVALFHAASAETRWTVACGLAVAEALEQCPGHGLRALRGVLGLPGNEKPFAEAEDRVVRRLDAVLAMYAKSAQHLAQIIWNALCRGDGDAFWSILELALCPSAEALFLATTRLAREQDVPQWLGEEPALWESFFACPEPPKSDACWEQCEGKNAAGSEAGKVYGIVGKPFPMGEAKLKSPFPADQAVLRVCKAPSPVAHWQAVDAVVRAAANGRNGKQGAAAKRWLRCVRATSGTPFEGAGGKLYVLPKEARSPVPLNPAAGIATECKVSLPNVPVTGSLFVFFLPIVASVYRDASGGKRTFADAVEACVKAIEGKGAQGKNPNGAVRMGIVTGRVPLRASSVVGSLRDAQTSGFASVITRVPGPDNDSFRVVRPFSDALPGSVEGALANFQWTRKMVCHDV